MTFTSITFLIFLALAFLVHWLLPERYRSLHLLLASYISYGVFSVPFLFLMVAVTIITYFFGLVIASTNDDKKRLKWKITAVIILILPLLGFKYFFGVCDNMFELLGITLFNGDSITIPIGISFYTFMSLGYIIDVHNEKVEVEKKITNIALFLAFFPIVFSGPIERGENLLKQIRNKSVRRFSFGEGGIKFILWGYLMKLCVAERLATYIDVVVDNHESHNGVTLLFAFILYPFQLYTDLGGYSLIAIGVSKLFGFDVVHNFNRPFFAHSMSEFWRKWHMSLIQWLTDYVYMPLTFSFRRYRKLGVVLSLMLTFLLSGLWHGVSLLYVIWGLLHGLFLSFEVLTKSIRANALSVLKLRSAYFSIVSVVLTFVLFSFSQIFARCSSLDMASEILDKIVSLNGSLFLDATSLGYGMFFLGIVFIKDLKDEYFEGKFKFLSSDYPIVRLFSFAGVLACIISSGVLDSADFIYFKY